MFHVQSRNRTVECNLVESKEAKGSIIEDAEIMGGKNFYCIFYAEDVILYEFVLVKQTVTDIKR